MGLQTRAFIKRIKEEYHEHLRGKFILIILILMILSYMIGYGVGFNSITGQLAIVGYKILKLHGYDSYMDSLIQECALRQGFGYTFNKIQWNSTNTS